MKHKTLLIAASIILISLFFLKFMYSSIAVPIATGNKVCSAYNLTFYDYYFNGTYLRLDRLPPYDEVRILVKRK